MGGIIYVDILFLENFLMNYILLYGINRFCNYRSGWRRICISSMFGALYVFTVFFDNFAFTYSAIMKIAVSIIMILIAFSPNSFRKIVRSIILFYIEAFILSGGILALFYLFNCKYEFINGAFMIEGLKSWHLIVGSVIVNIFMKLGFDFFENHYNIEKNMIEINIEFQNRSCSLKALIDTGNSLKDPVTNAPIIIVQLDSIIKILPQEIKESIERFYNDNNVLMQNLLLSDIKQIYRMIPYKTLGIDKGTLIGIEVDAVKINSKKMNRIIKNPVIAVYNNSVSELGEYEALAYPDILKGEFVCTD